MWSKVLFVSSLLSSTASQRQNFQYFHKCHIKTECKTFTRHPVHRACNSCFDRTSFACRFILDMPTLLSHRRIKLLTLSSWTAAVKLSLLLIFPSVPLLPVHYSLLTLFLPPLCCCQRAFHRAQRRPHIETWRTHTRIHKQSVCECAVNNNTGVVS